MLRWRRMVLPSNRIVYELRPVGEPSVGIVRETLETLGVVQVAILRAKHWAGFVVEGKWGELAFAGAFKTPAEARRLVYKRARAWQLQDARVQLGEDPKQVFGVDC